MKATGATCAALCGPLTAVSLLLVGVGPGERPQVSPQLGGPDRYLTHLSTDKPIYRIGETVFLRGVLLHANKTLHYTGPNVSDVPRLAYIVAFGYEWPGP